MADRYGKLPRITPTTPGDSFALALDHLFREDGCRGNVCRLVLDLDGPLDETRLSARLRGSRLVGWLARLHLVDRLPAGLARCFWCDGRTAAPVILHGADPETGRAAPHEELPSWPDLEARRAPCLAFDLVNRGDGSASVVLTWHHVLMDALGAGLLMRHLGRDPDPGESPEELRALIEPDPAVTLGSLMRDLPRRIIRARRGLEFVVGQSRMPLASLVRTRDGADRPAPRHVHLSLDESTTARVDTRAARLGATFYPGLFYLAATTRAFEKILSRRGATDDAWVVPVPQDQRRRGAPGPIFGNRYTFQFYRVERAETGSIEATIAVLRTQMIDQMRRDHPGNYQEMMGFLRLIPLWIYTWALRGPTEGQVSSFFFSYTGESPPDAETFLGNPVRMIRHFPPVARLPGVAVVFSRHRERIAIGLSLAGGSLDDDEVALFSRILTAELLGEGRE